LEFYGYLMICAVIILIITLPLQLRIITILLSRNKSFEGLESDFYRCLTHILMTDLISALISIIIVEPATYGVFREFYQNNSGWLAKLVIFQGSPLCTLSAYFHCIVAVNRFTAMIFTLKHQMIWTDRMLRCLHFGGWILTATSFLPLIWPALGWYQVVQSPFGDRGLSFVIAQSYINIPYQ
ncbi:hypothetical protein PENTCL1PPCAC_8190, partial [Pristionchus entomophagus]